MDKMALALLVMVSVVCLSCGDTDNGDEWQLINPDDDVKYPRVDIELNESQTAVNEAAVDFAFRFFAEEAKVEKSNLFVSPLSAQMALSMACNGATGTTKNQMMAALGYGHMTQGQMNDYNQKMVSELVAVDKTTTICIANSIWADQGFKLKHDFVTVNKEFYNAEISNIDFSSSSASSLINSWCSDKTHGLIDNIVEETSGIKTMLINALYFKGVWENKFIKSETVESVFRNIDGNTSNVSMMSQRHSFGYTKTDNYSVAEFPYGNESYSMVVFLPDENVALDDVLSTLTYEKWREIYAMMSYSSLDVKMPKFEIKYKTSLIECMNRLGMYDAFVPELASFGDLSDVPTFIDKLQQLAYIKVDEEGTEAAAVTSISVGITSLPGGPVSFHMDHPFIYIIKERSTGAILFMGKVVTL